MHTRDGADNPFLYTTGPVVFFFGPIADSRARKSILAPLRISTRHFGAG
jgi:hypothetical protein